MDSSDDTATNLPYKPNEHGAYIDSEGDEIPGLTDDSDHDSDDEVNDDDVEVDYDNEPVDANLLASVEENTKQMIDHFFNKLNPKMEDIVKYLLYAAIHCVEPVLLTGAILIDVKMPPTDLLTKLQQIFAVTARTNLESKSNYSPSVDKYIHSFTRLYFELLAFCSSMDSAKWFFTRCVKFQLELDRNQIKIIDDAIEPVQTTIIEPLKITVRNMPSDELAKIMVVYAAYLGRMVEETRDLKKFIGKFIQPGLDKGFLQKRTNIECLTRSILSEPLAITHYEGRARDYGKTKQWRECLYDHRMILLLSIGDEAVYNASRSLVDSALKFIKSLTGKSDKSVALAPYLKMIESFLDSPVVLDAAKVRELQQFAAKAIFALNLPNLTLKYNIDQAAPNRRDDSIERSRSVSKSSTLSSDSISVSRNSRPVLVSAKRIDAPKTKPQPSVAHLPNDGEIFVDELKMPLKEATDTMLEKEPRYADAVESYEQVLAKLKILANEKNISINLVWTDFCKLRHVDFLSLITCYARALARNIYGGVTTLENAEKEMRNLIDEEDDKEERWTFPYVFYELASLLIKMNRFDEAIEPLERASRIADNSNAFELESWFYPNPQLKKRKICLDKNNFEDLLAAQLKLAKAIHPFDKVCRCGEDDSICKQQGYRRSGIYFSDLDYRGHYTIDCTEQCSFATHLKCFKPCLDLHYHVKDEKELRSAKCFTDGCEGVLKKVIVYRPDATHKATVKLNIDELNEKYEAIKRQKEEARIKLEKKMELVEKRKTIALNKSKDRHDSIGEIVDDNKLKSNAKANESMQQSIDELEAMQIIETVEAQNDLPCSSSSTFVPQTAPPPNLPATRLMTAKKQGVEDLDNDEKLVAGANTNNKKTKKAAKADKRKNVLDLHSFLGDRMPKLSDGASSSSRYAGERDVLDDQPELAQFRRLVLDAVTESILPGHDPLPLSNDLFASYAQDERFNRLFDLYGNSWELFFKDTKLQVWDGTGIYFRKTTQESWIPPFAISSLYKSNKASDSFDASSYAGNYVDGKVAGFTGNVVGSRFVDNKYEKSVSSFITNTTVRLPRVGSPTPTESSVMTEGTMPPRIPDLDMVESPAPASLSSFRTETTVRVPRSGTLSQSDAFSLKLDQQSVSSSYNSDAVIRLPVVEPTHDQMGVEPPPRQMGVEHPSGQMGVEPFPGQMGVEPPPGQMGVEPPPGKMGVEPPPGQMGVEPPPGQMGVEPPPGQMGVEPLPGQSGVEAPPETLAPAVTGAGDGGGRVGAVGGLTKTEQLYLKIRAFAPGVCVSDQQLKEKVIFYRKTVGKELFRTTKPHVVAQAVAQLLMHQSDGKNENGSINSSIQSPPTPVTLEKCAICIEDISYGEKVTKHRCCGMCFHEQCIERWNKTNRTGTNTCPGCRNHTVSMMDYPRLGK